MIDMRRSLLWEAHLVFFLASWEMVDATGLNSKTKAERERNHPAGQEAVTYHSSSGTTNIVIILILPRKRKHSLRSIQVRASSKYVNGSPIAEPVKSMVSFYRTSYLGKLYLYTYGHSVPSKPF